VSGKGKTRKEYEKWLEEYEAKESEAGEEVVRRLKHRIDNSSEFDKPKFSELARMAYEDKFQFKELIAYPSPAGFPFISPKLLMPFNEQIIIHILPCLNEQDFVRIYHLTPQEIADLYDRNRVLPILDIFPRRLLDFKNDQLKVILDYLEPLFIKEIPSHFFRELSLLTIASKARYWDYLEKGDQVVKDVKIHTKKSKFTGEGVLPYVYGKLYSLGFEDLVDHIVEKTEPAIVYDTLLRYYELLCAPLLDGLGAMPQTTKSFERFSRLSTSEVSMLRPEITASKSFVFPVEIGQLLTEFYDLTFPSDPSLAIIDKMYSDNALTKARNLLKEFKKVVERSEGEGAVNIGKDLKEIFKEAYEALPALDKRVEKCKWMLNALAYGAVTSMGVLTHPVAGLLAGMGYKTAEKKVTEIVAPRLARIRYNPLSVAIWQFKREFDDVEELRTELKRIGKLR